MTKASAIKVKGTTDLYSYFPNWCQLGIKVDGVDHSTLKFNKNGQSVFDIDIGNLGTNKTVEVITGLQSTGGTATVKGTFIDSIYCAANNVVELLEDDITDRIIVYGDSIAAGGNSTNIPLQAWVPLLRTTYSRNVMGEAWGYRTLYDDCNTEQKRDDFATHLLSSNPSVIYLAIGTNDFGLSKWSASSFGSAISDLLDKIHSKNSSVEVKCQSPTYRTDEATPNGYGDDLQDYRDAESAACSGKSWATYYNGYGIIDGGDLDGDGIHLTTAGHAKYALAVDTFFG